MEQDQTETEGKSNGRGTGRNKGTVIRGVFLVFYFLYLMTFWEGMEREERECNEGRKGCKGGKSSFNSTDSLCNHLVTSTNQNPVGMTETRCESNVSREKLTLLPHVCPSGLRLEEEGGSVRTSALFSGGLHTCRVNPVSAQRAGHLNTNSRQEGTAQAHVQFGPITRHPCRGTGLLTWYSRSR